MKPIKAPPKFQPRPPAEVAHDRQVRAQMEAQVQELERDPRFQTREGILEWYSRAEAGTLNSPPTAEEAQEIVATKRPLRDAAYDRKVRAEMEARVQEMARNPQPVDQETSDLLDRIAAQAQQPNTSTDAEALTPSEIEHVRQDKKALTKWLATKGMKGKTV